MTGECGRGWGREPSGPHLSCKAPKALLPAPVRVGIEGPHFSPSSLKKAHSPQRGLSHSLPLPGCRALAPVPHLSRSAGAGRLPGPHASHGERLGPRAALGPALVSLNARSRALGQSPCSVASSILQLGPDRFSERLGPLSWPQRPAMRRFTVWPAEGAPARHVARLPCSYGPSLAWSFSGPQEMVP